MTHVGDRIERKPEPGGIAANALADRCSVLADAGGKDQCIEAPQRGSEGTELAPDAIAEKLDRLARMRIVGLQQLAHVARYARYAKESRAFVDQAFDRARVHAPLIHEVQKHARIE